jgi:hypothetical protein
MDTLNLTLAATLREAGTVAGSVRDRVPAEPAPETSTEPSADLTRWRELVAQIGEEIASPLTTALERVTTLTATGRIDKAGLRALREEIEHARHAGMICQQLSRLSGGRIAQSHERVHLTHTLQSVLAHRTREMHARGAQVKQTLQPVEVIADAPLLFGLLNALIDWSMVCAHGPIELTVDTKPWPAYGRLTCRFPHRPVDESERRNLTRPPADLNTLVWRLIEHTAQAIGLTLLREKEGAHIRLTLEFPRTINPLLETSVPELADAGSFGDSVNSKPLAGSHVLVISSRRDTRVQVREAIKHMGLVVDYVSSVEEASEFCSEGLPNAIVIESVLKGARFKQLATDIRTEVPDFVFIEIDEHGAEFQISTVSASGHARLGRDAIMSALPSALVYELTRVM